MLAPEDALPLRLRMLRAMRRRSQQELAGRVGVSQDTIGRWERGQAFPPADRLVILARELGVCLDYLCGVSEAMNGLPPGHWLVDLDAIDSPSPGREYAYPIPSRARICSYQEMQQMIDKATARRGRK